MLRSETTRQFAGFSLIGLVNTGIHLAVVTSLVEWARLHPALANGLAFVCANVFSFFANSRWTFRSAASLSRYLRFVTVSLAGLAIAMAASALGAALHWHYLAGVLLSFALLPVLSFAANKYWTWKTPD
ncbi:GtrA family protein [uncultured Xylophilus sp.]|uniref:GtrA family protein n=1 Tax=uncultured Xylophilus sp. TaxID=296832 RepID=UPI0025D2BF86|nr:GtrA family protein [uncultured Xylophilus sp.]